MRDITRTPIIPLDLEHQARAVNREILIDYDRGEIWVVSPTDKNKLINLTSKIKQAVTDYIDSYQGSQITDITNTYVTIDGIGRINVAEFLKFISEHSIHGFPANNSKPMALTRLAYDNESILALRNKVVVAGFPEAGEDYIPVKKNGTIQWTPISNLPTPEGYTPNKYDISETLPIDGVITLTENPIQKSLNLEGVISLKLPTPTETNYCYLKWIVSTEDKLNTAIIFDKRIIWRYLTDADMARGTAYIYEFETYDSGNTWYGKKTSFNNSIDGASIITREEANATYFTKQEVIDLMSWEAMDEEALHADDQFGGEGSGNEFIKGSALLGIQYYLDDLTYNPGTDETAESPVNLAGISKSIIDLNKDVNTNAGNITILQDNINDLDNRVTTNTENIDNIKIQIETPIPDPNPDEAINEENTDTESK